MADTHMDSLKSRKMPWCPQKTKACGMRCSTTFIADLFRSDVTHIVWHQINGACDGVLASLKILSGQGRLFVDFLDDFLGLVRNHNLRPRPCHATHLGNGTRLVIEEIDTANVKHNVEDAITKWQPFRFALEQFGGSFPLCKALPASLEHSP